MVINNALGNTSRKVRISMRKVYLATIITAVTTAIVGGIMIMQFADHTTINTAATLSQSQANNPSQAITAQNTPAGNDGGNNFGPPDNGGFDSGDQLLG